MTFKTFGHPYAFAKPLFMYDVGPLFAAIIGCMIFGWRSMAFRITSCSSSFQVFSMSLMKPLFVFLEDFCFPNVEYRSSSLFFQVLLTLWSRTMQSCEFTGKLHWSSMPLPVNSGMSLRSPTTPAPGQIFMPNFWKATRVALLWAFQWIHRTAWFWTKVSTTRGKTMRGACILHFGSESLQGKQMGASSMTWKRRGKISAKMPFGMRSKFNQRSCKRLSMREADQPHTWIVVLQSHGGCYCFLNWLVLANKINVKSSQPWWIQQ